MMTKRLLLLSALAIMPLLSCSKKTEIDRSAFTYPDTIFLSQADFTADQLIIIPEVNGFQPTAEPLTTIRSNAIDPQSTSKSSNYLNYNFVGLTQSSYAKNQDTINVEIAEFLTPDDAYGFFSEDRPNGIRAEAIGAESYVMNSIRYVVHGRFVISLSSDKMIESVAQGMIDIAVKIDSSIEDKASISPYYLLFPYRNKINPSTKFVSFNFMNIGSLNNVYTTDYLIDEDTLTLFMAVDPDNLSFRCIKAFAERTKKTETLPRGFSFHKNQAVMFIHPEYGRVLAGTASEKLVGIIGFDPEKHLKMARLWVWGLQQ